MTRKKSPKRKGQYSIGNIDYDEVKQARLKRYCAFQGLSIREFIVDAMDQAINSGLNNLEQHHREMVEDMMHDAEEKVRAKQPLA